jgi:hypothetical protein
MDLDLFRRLSLLPPLPLLLLLETEVTRRLTFTLRESWREPVDARATQDVPVIRSKDASETKKKRRKKK